MYMWIYFGTLFEVPCLYVSVTSPKPMQGRRASHGLVVPRLRLPFWAQLTSPPQPLLSPIPNRGSPVERTPKLGHSLSGHMLGAVLTPEPPPPSTRRNDSSSCQSSRLPGQPPAREDPGQFPACCEERDGCARADGCRACSRRLAVSRCLRLAVCGLNCFTLQALLAGFGRGRGQPFYTCQREVYWAQDPGWRPGFVILCTFFLEEFRRKWEVVRRVPRTASGT